MALRLKVLHVFILAAFLLLWVDCGLFEPRDPKSLDDDPAWSPDGRTIAFVRYNSDRPGLYFVGPNGSGLRLLLAGQYTTPCWSPDGEWLAFATHDGRMCRVRANGQDLTSLTDSSDGFCSNPDWSATGLLVYVSDRNEPPGARGFWVMKPDGTEKRGVGLHDVFGPNMPSWSPDGSRLAFCRYYRDGPLTELAIVDSSGGGEVRLTTDDSLDLEPDWSPTGDRIAFTSGRSVLLLGEYGVCVIDLDDGARWRAADSAARSPSWSPDGQRLCISRTSFSAPGPGQVSVGPGRVRSSLWVVDSDGRNAKQITY